MSTPLLTPEPEPLKPERPLAGRLLQGLGLLLLLAVVSAASAFGVVEWRMRSEQALAAADLANLRDQTLREVSDLRAEVANQQAVLQGELQRVQAAAEATGLLLQKEGEVTGLQARLAELDTLKLDLRQTQQALESKLQSMEKAVLEQVAQSEKQTAQSLSLEMRYKNHLIKAQGEVLLAQVHWAEGNRGLAKDELAVASRTLQQALTEAPEAARPGIKAVVDQAEQTKAALILEQASSRDALNMLWHQVSELLTAPAQP